MMKATKWLSVISVIGLLALLAGCSSTAAQGQVSNANGTQPQRTAQRLLGAARMTYISSLQMENAKAGWIWGYEKGAFALANTQNGGKTWEHVAVPAAVPGMPASLFGGAAVYFENSFTGWLAWVKNSTASTVTVLRTTDGGAKWEAMRFLAPNGTQDTVISLQFANATHGWLLLESDAASGRMQNTLYQTEDGGVTWHVASVDSGYVPSTLPATKDALPEWGLYMGLVFRNDRTGFAYMENSGFGPANQVPLYRTTDGGHTWHPVSMVVPQGFSGRVDYLAVGKPVFSGNNGVCLVQVFGKQSFAETYRTENGGRTWQPTGTKIEGNGVQTQFLTAQTGWQYLQHSQRFLLTKNGGRAWSAMKSNNAFSLFTGKQQLEQFDPISATTYFAITATMSGQSNLLDTAQLWRTVDAGVRWERVNLSR